MLGLGRILVTFRLLLCIYLTKCQAPKTLQFVNVLFRHGDRSAIKSFPGDLHAESAWPQGYGQLSQTGMRQEFALGSYLRSRYSSFLSDSYKRHEVYLQSTAVDRTIMSAQCVLAGLFQPTGDQLWRPQLAWQPIAIHTSDIDNDKLLRYNFELNACPTLKKHQDGLENSPIVKQLRARHQGLLRRLNNLTNGVVSQISQLSSLHDGLLCESLHNLTLPDWVTEAMMREMHSEILPPLQMAKFCSRQATRLTGGMLLQKMLSDMQVVVQKLLNETVKTMMYSAHDTTVLAMMCAFDVYNHQLVPYATSMYIELHHDGPEVTYTPDMRGWYVQVWLRNETYSNPYLLTVPGCTANCSLSKLINLTRGSIADDWMAECGYLTFPYITKLWHVVLITIAIGVAVVFSLLVVTSCCNGGCTRRRLRPRPATYGKLRATTEVTSRPEEMSMLNSVGGDSDMEG